MGPNSLQLPPSVAAYLCLTSTCCVSMCEYDVETNGTLPQNYRAETSQISLCLRSPLRPHLRHIFLGIDRDRSRAFFCLVLFGASCITLENRVLHPTAPLHRLSHDMQLWVRRKAMPRSIFHLSLFNARVPGFWRLLPSVWRYAADHISVLLLFLILVSCSRDSMPCTAINDPLPWLCRLLPSP